jgi:hypothetical protein
MVAKANLSPKPLQAFLDLLRTVPGYREDPLQKKAMLLAMILENRPERFLRVTDRESDIPIVDYHLQRSALRTGLVVIEDEALRKKIAARIKVDRETEQELRKATAEAIQQLVDLSGLSMAAIDFFFFTNRTRCPEMTEPRCSDCPVQQICRQERHLFQPVFRTTFY